MFTTLRNDETLHAVRSMQALELIRQQNARVLELWWEQLRLLTFLFSSLSFGHGWTEQIGI